MATSSTSTKYPYEYDLNEDSINLKRILKHQLPCFVSKNLNYLKISLNKNELNLNDNNKAIFICDVLIDYTWEMLNTNIWVFVDDVWRLLYAYSTLFKAIFLKKKFGLIANSCKTNEERDKFNQDIIKLCDLGFFLFIKEIFIVNL